MEFKNNKAIYIQISDTICDAVLSGKYRAGDRIPSVREYAAEVEVNANTVMRSYADLEQQGIIYNKRGIGFFIADDAVEIIKQLRRREFFSDEIEYFFNRLRSLEISPDELRELYANHCNK